MSSDMIANLKFCAPAWLLSNFANDVRELCIIWVVRNGIIKSLSSSVCLTIKLTSPLQLMRLIYIYLNYFELINEHVICNSTITYEWIQLCLLVM